MSVTQYKCPNCGGAIVFDPATQDIICPYCKSHYTKKDFDGTTAKAGADDGFESDAATYTCGNCGAQIVTTATTAATYCYFCHTPVVLEKRLSGTKKPDYVLPFKLTKDQATERLTGLFKSARFLPPIFKDRGELEKVSGVYFPYWFTDSDADVALRGTGQNIRVWRAGDYEYTETSIYEIRRGGNVLLNSLSEPAIKDAGKVNLDYVCPFDDTSFENFSMTYLAGLFAEQRELDQLDVAEKMRAKMNTLAGNAVRSTIGAYSSVSVDSLNVDVKNTVWKYALLPVWVMTYNVEGTRYVYAINGQSGKIYGDLPVDKKKLNRVSALITAACAILGLLAGAVTLL
ncbi:MAG: TFIIB-type zinc ribbon-containing protein [Oscillospiraceae bacterium]|nr:TFIIB-type zinc ribbon-containing protein [Oscillospiraceae bacterium]